MKPPAIKKYFAGLSRDTFLLAAVSLFADISTEMLYPILPVFLTQYLQAGGSVVGLVEGVAQATQNIIQGFSGWLSDRLRIRKPVAFVGYTLSAISKPLIGVSSVWQQVLTFRFLDRLGTGTRSAPRDALIAGSVDTPNRGKAFGLEGIGDNLGAFIGPLITVAILFAFHLDIRSIFYLAFIPGLIAVAAIALVREKAPQKTARTKVAVSLKNLPRPYWLYLLATAVFGLGNVSNSFLILQSRSLGISLQLTIIVYAFFNLIASITSYPSGFLSDKYSRKSVLLAGLVIFVLTYLGFAFSHNLLLVGIAFVLYGIFQGIFRTVGKTLASDYVPATMRASGVGWYLTVVGLTSLISSLVAGQLWDNLGHPTVFIWGAAWGGLGIVAFIILVPRHLPVKA